MTIKTLVFLTKRELFMEFFPPFKIACVNKKPSFLWFSMKKKKGE